jgi:hypothetical protein
MNCTSDFEVQFCDTENGVIALQKAPTMFVGA